ncbi:BlaI/MecI/CopY family transcriptional regulator [Scopulibacillus cellulosilyticus]|uniref:BlaI/MecI/CopY family transcriptional regulator n=1 Tax=Scopulibacillus cellulosilyticus TaxID=2665665 RepID=A0ABW2PS57_9BACL
MSVDSTLANILGPLELKVMKCLWAFEEATVQKVLDALNKKEDYAYTTIMTVMSRLAQKGILQRVKSGRSYQYKPIYTEEALIRHMSSQAVHQVLDHYGDTAIAQFVDTVGASPEQLKKLKDLIDRLEGEKPDEKD